MEAWSTADRDPVDHWGNGRATLLGDAAHPMSYMAQGACIALEDAVTLREAIRTCKAIWSRFPALRVEAHRARRPREHFGARNGRLYHARGVERLVRNSLWVGRTPERYYDALEWLYGWRVDECLA